MSFITKLIRGTICLVIYFFLALLVYGIAIIVFRQAYGIELPNVVSWTLQHWPKWLSFL